MHCFLLDSITAHQYIRDRHKVISSDWRQQTSTGTKVTKQQLEKTHKSRLTVDEPSVCVLF